MTRRIALAVALCLLAGGAAAQTLPSTTIATVQSAATTNATSTKATQGILYGFSLCNNTASVKFFKFYNKATAPTVGTDAVFFKVQIPANACRDRSSTIGMTFGTGIAWAITGAQADTDTTAVASGDVTGSFDYK